MYETVNQKKVPETTESISSQDSHEKDANSLQVQRELIAAYEKYIEVGSEKSLQEILISKDYSVSCLKIEGKAKHNVRASRVLDKL